MSSMNPCDMHFGVKELCCMYTKSLYCSGIGGHLQFKSILSYCGGCITTALPSIIRKKSEQKQ